MGLGLSSMSLIIAESLLCSFAHGPGVFSFHACARVCLFGRSMDQRVELRNHGQMSKIRLTLLNPTPLSSPKSSWLDCSAFYFQDRNGRESHLTVLSSPEFFKCFDS